MSTPNLFIVMQDGMAVVKDDSEVYPSHSVLAGQPIIKFVDSFDTIEEAQAVYPEAQLTHDLIAPHNTFDHLPDDTDY